MRRVPTVGSSISKLLYIWYYETKKSQLRDVCNTCRRRRYNDRKQKSKTETNIQYLHINLQYVSLQLIIVF